MNPNEQSGDDERTGVDDVRVVRERIAVQHGGDLAAHIAETNRIAEELRDQLRLGPIVSPPSRIKRQSGTEG